MTTREKRMLAACGAVLFVSATSLVAKEYMDRSQSVDKRIATLEAEKLEAEAWIKDRAFQDKRAKWLDQMLPKTDSLGRAQGELLEELQNAVLDRGLKILRTTLNDPSKTPHYEEVTVNLQVRGDMAVTMDWLATLQSPELFQIIKALEIDPDSRAKEKTPQCFTTITIARWFKPEGV